MNLGSHFTHSGQGKGGELPGPQCPLRKTGMRIVTVLPGAAARSPLMQGQGSVPGTRPLNASRLSQVAVETTRHHGHRTSPLSKGCLRARCDLKHLAKAHMVWFANYQVLFTS